MPMKLQNAPGLSLNSPVGEIPGAPHAQTRSEVVKEKKKPFKFVTPNVTMHRSVTGVLITPQGKVKLKIVETITAPPKDPLGESTTTTRKHTSIFDDAPHQDLLSAMKNMREDGMMLNDDDPRETENRKKYTVVGLDIRGNMEMKQARAVLTLGKFIKRTNKINTTKLSEVTLYGQSEYEHAERLAQRVEKAIDEATQFMYGKFADSNPNQLALFVK